MTSISVLTLAGGRQSHLLNLIDALTRSNEPPFELIIAQLDPTIGEEYAAPFPVRTLRLPDFEATRPRLRLAEARNLAANAAGGELLMFMDVDCLASADLMGVMQESLTTRNEIICPEVLYLRHPLTMAWTQADIEKDGVRHPARSFPQRGLMPENNSGLLWSVAFGMRASTFRQVGGFDNEYVGYGAEDTDFAFQARARGTGIMLLGGVPVCHQCHEVYHPPLQHFEDIVTNARRFKMKWGVWPMDNWLAEFAGRGLITWHPQAETLTLLRLPHPKEIAAARQPLGTPF